MIKKILGSIVDIILITVGLASTYLSFMYSWQWLQYIGTPTSISAVLAMILVVFAVCVFEFAAYTLRNNWKNAGGYALLLVWGLLAFYSMIGTLSSQYWQFQKIENSRIEEKAGSSNREYILDDLDSRIDRAIAKYESLEEIILSYDTPELRAMWRTTILGYRNDQAKASEDLDALYLEKQELLKSDTNQIILNNDENEITIFEIYSKLFEWNPKNVQFIMQTFPALFIDLISPLCFLFIMFDLSKAKLKKEEEELIPEPDSEVISGATESKGKILITPDTIYGEIPIKKKSPKKKKTPKQINVDVRNMYGDDVHSETRLTLDAAVKLYAAVRWYGIINKKTKHLLGKDSVLSNTKISAKQYDRITKVALDNKLIVKSGVWSYPANDWTKEQFVNAIVTIFNEKNKKKS